MQVLAALGPKVLSAAVIRADKSSVDLLSRPPLVLFAPVCSVLRLLHGTHLCVDFILVEGLFIILSFQSHLLDLQVLASLPLLGLLLKLGLVLLLPQPMQKLMRLSENLGYEGVLIEVLDVEDLSGHAVVGAGCLVDIGHQVLVLEIHSPELFVVVNIWVISWRLLHVDILYLAWANGARS